MPFPGRLRQRRLTVVSILQLDVRLGLEQQLDYGLVPVLGRPRQRRLTEKSILLLAARLGLKQQLDYALVPVPSVLHGPVRVRISGWTGPPGLDRAYCSWTAGRPAVRQAYVF